MFDEKVRAALACCEALTACDVSAFPALHDALRALFGERELAEIAAIVINMNLWTRLKLAQGQVPIKG